MDPGYPLIRSLEAESVAIQGTTVTFRGDAVGSQPLRYPWWLDDTPIPEATNATFGNRREREKDLATFIGYAAIEEDV